MKCPTWFPWLGWVELDAVMAKQLGIPGCLDPKLRHWIVTFEWFGNGVVLFSKSTKRK